MSSCFYPMLTRAFICFLIGRACASTAFSILSISLGWHIYQLTGDPFDLALIGLISVLPMIIFFLITGIVVDRFPRKAILLTCFILQTLNMFAMAFVMTQETISLISVFTILFLIGCTLAFQRPAQEAILPNIVSDEFFPKAVSINAITWNCATTGGPFIGGLLLAWLDYQVYWCLTLICFVAFLSYCFLPKLTHVKPTGRKLSQIVGGIQFVRNSPIVLGCISIDLFLVLFGAVIALLPIYAADILKVGPEALGVLRAMPALGAVMVGLMLTQIDEIRPAGKVLFMSLFIFAGSILVFAFSTTMWISIVALWVYGGSDMVSVNVRQTLIQSATPNNLRGRVGAVNSLFISCSNQLGDFRAGAVAAIVSPVMTVAIGGAMAIGIVAGSYAIFPSIRKLDRLSDVRAKE